MEENLEHSEWMKGIKGTGFTTPSNYFESLNAEISARLSAERLKAFAAEDGYSVPEGYFDTLQAAIVAKTSGIQAPAPKPKIVRLWRSGILKYASAACFVIIAGAGLYFNMDRQRPAQKAEVADAAAEQLLFDIDEDVIIEHIEANYNDEQKGITSEAAMENYILNNYSQNDLSGNL